MKIEPRVLLYKLVCNLQTPPKGAYTTLLSTVSVCVITPTARRGTHYL